jgi:hypothetical protein
MAGDEPDDPVKRTKEGYRVTPESLSIDNLGTKLAVRADTYLARLEAIADSQERQARRSLSAARAAAVAGALSVVCAALLAAATVLPGDNRDTTYAHCQMVVTTTPSPSQGLLSMCMRAAGYRDWCREKEGSFPGAVPECFLPGNFILWVRDAIR